MKNSSRNTMIIVADDLSGAADCAIPFVKCGANVAVVVSGDCTTPPDAEIIALDLDTRRLSAQQAAARIKKASDFLHRFDRVYKKTDSTLRGNWAAEIATLVPQLGIAFFAPAFPAVGRMVVDGEVVVHGIPLHKTETWQLEHAGVSSNIASQLHSQGLHSEHISLTHVRADSRTLKEHIESARQKGANVIVFDSETDADLNNIAIATATADFPLFWAGSGGLASQLAQSYYMKELSYGASVEDILRQRHSRTFVSIIGSLSKVSVTQAELLHNEGRVERLVLPPELLRAGKSHHEWLQWQQLVIEHITRCQDLILQIGQDHLFNPSEGPRLSQSIALLIQPILYDIGILFVTGGETAHAVFTYNKIDHLHLIAELDTGIALAQTSQPSAPLIITKAGAFGRPQSLLNVLQLIHGTQSELTQ